MRSYLSVLCGALALTLALCADNARAAALLQDNFDSYASSAALQGAWAAQNGVNLPTLDSTTSFSAPNSVLTSTNSTRFARTFTDTAPTALQNVEFSFRFFDGSLDTASPRRQYAEMDDTLVGCPTRSR